MDERIAARALTCEVRSRWHWPDSPPTRHAPATRQFCPPVTRSGLRGPVWLQWAVLLPLLPEARWEDPRAAKAAQTRMLPETRLAVRQPDRQNSRNVPARVAASATAASPSHAPRPEWSGLRWETAHGAKPSPRAEAQNP